MSMKFMATDSTKIKDIPVKKGQLIFSRDDRTIYLDSTERTSYQTFIILDTDEERQNLISPVNGFYFIEETKVLWRLLNNIWTQLNVSTKPTVVFIKEGEEKPTEPSTDVLYVQDGKIYQWSLEKNDYIIVSDVNWESIA